MFSALPKPPVSLKATNITHNSVQLQWRNENAEPVESYIVRYRRKEVSGESAKEVFDIVTTDHVLTSLLPNTLYQIHLMAVNNIGRSSPGNSMEVRTREAGELFVVAV